MWIERIAQRLDRWQRRPRFRAPTAAILLPALLVAGLLASLARSSAPPSPQPAPAPQRIAAPPPLTEVTLPVELPAVTPKPAEPGCPQGCAEPPPGCEIKGNISLKTGEKIYHLPGQWYYDSTEISPARGEAWFCTEAEARENGWRKSKR